MRRLLVALVLLAPVVASIESRTARAVSSSWPSCTSASQVECVESLSYTTAAGTFTVADPGTPTMNQPYVNVVGASPSNPSSTVGFSVLSPASTSLAPNVTTGLEEGTYSFVIRLGTYDPTQTGLMGEPVSITNSQQADGTFKLSVTAKPKPRVMAMSQASYESCKASGWTCQGEMATVRNISGFVFQNVIPENRPLFRGMWIATNASDIGFPVVSVLERKVSAKIAGPHTVPDGFPTAGLTMENGKGVNPAFYKFYMPYTVMEAMLSMAPAQIKSSITPEMVKATITEAASQKDQPVTLVTSDTGMTVDLGITHFSAPNPEVTFYTPAQIAAQKSTPTTSSSVTSKKFAVGKKYLPGDMVTVPSGYRATKTVVSSASRSVCAVSGSRILVKKKGSCSFTVTATKGSARKTIRGKVSVG
ncbi:MAG: hypothetical protein RJA47_108 [Actinomycetota bacterium]